MPSYDVTVVGTVGRDLALRVEHLPGPDESARVLERREQAGGKGASIAVAAARRDVRVALVGVVGHDRDGADVCGQLESERVDIRHVIRRDGAATPLLIGIAHVDGTRHYLEDLPDGTLLTPADIDAAADVLTDTAALIVSLQIPAAAAATAGARAQAAGARVVLDGAPDDPAYRGILLGLADVVRADAREIHPLAGRPVRSVDDALQAARDLLGRGPSLVAVAVPGHGDLLVWRDGQVLLPLADVPVVDPTGAGDAFVATLAVELAHGVSYEIAGRRAASAAAEVVSVLGARP